MNHPFLILKMGKTFPEVLPQIGDFDQWTREALPLPQQKQVQILRPGQHLPSPGHFAGLIITGSHSMVTEPSPEEQACFTWVQDAVQYGLPVLGLCYGHQMLGHILGGKVGYLPGGPEIGYVDVELFPDAHQDPLLSVYNVPTHNAFAFHYQSVLRLPLGAQNLGQSYREPNHAVRYTEKTWGVQYHPEFTPKVAQTYLQFEHTGVTLPSKLPPRDLLLERFVDLFS